MNILIVFVGGAIGAILRYVITYAVSSILGLFIVNSLGSFFMGILQSYFRKNPHNKWQLFFTTGLIGSFTTFSAFSAQWFSLLEHSFINGIIFALTMTVCCILLAAVGFKIESSRGSKI